MIKRLCDMVPCGDDVFILTIVTVAVLMLNSPFALAREEFFLPNTLVQGDNRQHSNFSSLNNTQLKDRAESLRSQELDANQRALNYQWLENQRNKEFTSGSKAYKAFFKRGFKEYWDRKRKEHFKSEHIPNLEGRGRVSGEVDYDLRLSSDELKIGLTYEF